jgi:hypothetical protein
VGQAFTGSGGGGSGLDGGYSGAAGANGLVMIRYQITAGGVPV